MPFRDPAVTATLAPGGQVTTIPSGTQDVSSAAGISLLSRAVPVVPASNPMSQTIGSGSGNTFRTVDVSQLFTLYFYLFPSNISAGTGQYDVWLEWQDGNGNDVAPMEHYSFNFGNNAGFPFSTYFMRIPVRGPTLIIELSTGNGSGANTVKLTCFGDTRIGLARTCIPLQNTAPAIGMSLLCDTQAFTQALNSSQTFALPSCTGRIALAYRVSANDYGYSIQAMTPGSWTDIWNFNTESVTYSMPVPDEYHSEISVPFGTALQLTATNNNATTGRQMRMRIWDIADYN